MKVVGSPPERIECLPSELRAMKKMFVPPKPDYEAILNPGARSWGVPVVIVMPKGYPTKVTPRPRKKGRRR